MKDDTGIGPWWLPDDEAALLILVGAVLYGAYLKITRKRAYHEGQNRQRE